eukprot:6680576-Prymnesium_polylepis.1
MEKSAYELERDNNIAQNRAHLQSLGLEPLAAASAPLKRRAAKTPRPEATRASSRLRSAAPSDTGAVIDDYGDDERLLRERIRAPSAAAAAATLVCRPANAPN